MKINITYKDDTTEPKYNEQVFVNGIHVGQLERGHNYGFWFKNKIGGDIHKEDIKDLKIEVEKLFNNYFNLFEKL